MNIVHICNNFASQKDCISYLEKIRWGDTPRCPYCDSDRSVKRKSGRRHCNGCNSSYSVTVGTIFHKTKIDLQKWFLAMSLVLNARKGISARQLARDIGVNKNTAWSMMMRIREAMKEGDLLDGIVEADETYIGGRNKNRHYEKKTYMAFGRGSRDKVVVFGMIERGGKARAMSVPNATMRALQPLVHANVRRGATMMTDEWRAYKHLHKEYKHKVIIHASGQYVNGNIHTNTIEGFWAIVKRGIMGQYHQVSRKHIDKYLQEFCFRYNYRDNDEVFDLLLAKSLTLKHEPITNSVIPV